MEEQIKQIQNNAIEEISLSQDVKALEETKVKYLGKKGELTAILRGMGGLSPEERPIIGSLVNEVREKIELILKQKEEELKSKEMEEKLKTEKIDITLPSTKIRRGSKHPVNRIIEEVEDIPFFVTTHWAAGIWLKSWRSACLAQPKFPAKFANA